MEVLLASDQHWTEEAIREAVVRDGVGRSVRNIGYEQLPNEVARRQPSVVILEVPARMSETFFDLVREVRQLSTGRLLVVGGTQDAKTILTVLRCGANHYLGLEDIRTDLAETLQQLGDDTYSARRHQAHTIAVVGAGGGCGTSTVAVNLAVAYADAQGTSGLIDLKLESGDLAALLDLKTDHSIVDCCRNMNRMDRGMFENCLAAHRSGVRLLPSPPTLDDLAWISPGGVRRAVSLARSIFPYVVIDVGLPYRDEHTQALYQCDIALLVMRLDFSSLRQAHRILDHLQARGIEREQVRLVINRITSGGDLRVRDVEKALRLRASQALLEDPRRVNRSNNRGVPMLHWAPSSKVSRQLRTLANSVNGACHVE